MVSYRVINRLSGPLRIRFGNGEFVMLMPGEPVIFEERKIGAVKDHPGIHIDELSNYGGVVEAKKSKRSKRGK